MKFVEVEITADQSVNITFVTSTTILSKLPPLTDQENLIMKKMKLNEMKWKRPKGKAKNIWQVVICSKMILYEEDGRQDERISDLSHISNKGLETQCFN